MRQISDGPVCFVVSLKKVERFRSSCIYTKCEAKISIGHLK